MKKLILALLAVVAIVGCNKKNGGTEESITLQTDKEQVIYADETSKNEGIKFTAKEPWSATVSDATKAGSSVEWLRLLLDEKEKYEGVAGSYTLTIELDANYTGSDRKAEIRIVCGSSTITILIEQKATTQEGTILTPKLISSITTQILESNKWHAGSVDFTYDNLNRVIKINQNGSWESTFSLTYNTNNISYQGNGQSNSSCKSIAQIVDNRIVTGETQFSEEYHGEVYTSNDKYTLTYDSNGYLDSNSIQYKDRETNCSVYWSNENLTMVEWGGNNYIDIAEYGKVENKTNIDLNWFLLYRNLEGMAFCSGDGYNIFSALGYVGKRSTNLATKTSSKMSSSTSVYKYEYTLDGDGDPIKIVETHKTTNETGSIVFKESAEFRIEYK